MSHTITVRLDDDLARWLEDTSARTGVPQGKIVRDQLEQAKARTKTKSFMRLAGTLKGPKDLSKRKGFSEA
jgi:predicted transcriptional regulator